MRTFRFDKLVRDKIVSIMEGDGSVVAWRRLDDDAEYADALAQKLQEEQEELDEGGGLDRDKDLGELADVAEVHEALTTVARRLGTMAFYRTLRAAATEIDVAMEEWDIEHDELMDARAAKNAKAGAFAARIFVDTVSVSDERTDIIAWYQAKNYPEV